MNISRDLAVVKWKNGDNLKEVRATMNYERFCQLWDALVTNRPKPTDAPPISNGMSDYTASALIEYGQGDRTKVNEVRKKLGRPAVN